MRTLERNALMWLCTAILTLASCSMDSEFDTASAYLGLVQNQVSLDSVLEAGSTVGTIDLQAFRIGNAVYVALRNRNSSKPEVVILDNQLKVKGRFDASALSGNASYFPSGNDFKVTGLSNSTSAYTGAPGPYPFAVLSGTFPSASGSVYKIAGAIVAGGTGFQMATGTYNSVPTNVGDRFLTISAPTNATYGALTLATTAGTTLSGLDLAAPLAAASANIVTVSIPTAFFTVDAGCFLNGSSLNTTSTIFGLSPLVIETGYGSAAEFALLSAPYINKVSGSGQLTGFPVFWLNKDTSKTSVIDVLTNGSTASLSGTMRIVATGSNESSQDATQYYQNIRVVSAGFIVPYPSGNDRLVDFYGNVVYTFSPDSKDSWGTFAHAYVSGYDSWFLYDANRKALYKLKGWWK